MDILESIKILESIECMEPYWEKTLFPSIMEIYKDSEEVKFLSDHPDLSELKKLKEIRAKDILPHVMNLPLKEYYTEEFLKKNPNLNLQKITQFVIDCYYLDIIQYVINCRAMGIAPDLNFLSDHSDLSDLEKLEDIRAKDIIEDASKVPLKEYYRELYEILDLTLQKITQFVIDCSTALSSKNESISIQVTGSSSNEDDEYDEDTGSSSDKDIQDGENKDGSDEYIQVKDGSGENDKDDKDDEDTKQSSGENGENKDGPDKDKDGPKDGSIQVKDESDGSKDRSGSIFISWVEPTFRFLRSRISIHVLLASQAINMSVYVLTNGSESGIFIPTLVLISSCLYLIHTMIMSYIGYKQNKKLKKSKKQVKLQIKEQIEKKEKADNLCILLYIQIKALAFGFILLQIIVPQILNEEPSVYGVISFSIELMLIISVSHCSILNLLEKKKMGED